jgi:hypothetical protein
MAGTHIRLVGSSAENSVTTNVLLGPVGTAPRRRVWWRDSARVEDILSSPAAFLVSFAICWVACGFGAYFYAQWTLGMT